jgi:hypothetical protein
MATMAPLNNSLAVSASMFSTLLSKIINDPLKSAFVTSVASFCVRSLKKRREPVL